MDQRTRWDQNAKNWIAWARPPDHDHFFHEFNLPAFIPLLPRGPGRCLDLGCGEGRAGRAVTQTGFEVIGLDGSPTLAAHALSAVGGFPTSAGDASALPFRDRSFDLVVAFMSLHDIDDITGTLTETARVLRPGGILCAAIIHPMFSAGCVQLVDRDTTRLGGHGYQAVAPYQETVRMNGIAVTLYSIHRPLEAHITALVEAGFVLETLREPEPTSDYLAAHPDASPLADIPLYLHYRARKSVINVAHPGLAPSLDR